MPLFLDYKQYKMKKEYLLSELDVIAKDNGVEDTLVIAARHSNSDKYFIGTFEKVLKSIRKQPRKADIYLEKLGKSKIGLTTRKSRSYDIRLEINIIGKDLIPEYKDSNIVLLKVKLKSNQKFK